MNQKPNHLRALLTKNFILQKRNWCGSLCEILLPIFFLAIFASLKQIFETENFPQQSYIQNISNLPQQVYYGKFYPQITDYPQTNYKQLAKAGIMKNCKKGSTVAIGPSSTIILEDIKYIFNNMSLTTKTFDSMQSIEDYVKSSEYPSSTQICFGIYISENLTNKWEYQLIYNITQSQRRSQLYPTSLQRIISLGLQVILLFIQGLNYELKSKKSGIFLIQTLIDNLILKQYQSNGSIQTEITSQQIQAYQNDPFVNIAQYNIDFYSLLPLIVIFTRMLYKILIEKEKKIREGMKMMGMSNNSFYLSWYISYSVNNTIISLLASLILSNFILTKQGFIFIFILYILFTQVLIFMGFFISVFFSKAKPGVIGGLVFFFASYFFIGQDTVSQSLLMSISVSPFTTAYLGLKTLLYFQANSKSISWNLLDLEIENYSLYYSYIFLSFHLLFWSMSAVYLDQVFPNEFGSKKHPLFFLNIFKMKSKKNQIKSNQIINTDIEEEVDQLFQQQDYNNQTVNLNSVCHIYPTGKTAVHDLSFKMYSGQIFALLGGNGAGKTTTISMLTGLLSFTKGSAKILGYDVEEQMNEIRKIMGVCPQFDILYDDLTVKEHLELFARFKGSDPELMKDEVDKMISDLNLREKTNELAKNLSGGQRRRLSTGIAFIGNSKFILLDEPTSGMDTSARRHIWEILKNFKNDRIILLTTHFMDEADYLGDRIAIMGEGKLKCIGSSVFLKNQFGVGYTLTVVKKQQIQLPEIEELIKKYVPDGQVLQDVSSELIFQLPLKQVDKFQSLFDYLDQNLDQLQIESYGVSITTLEEVFIRTQQLDLVQQQDQFDAELVNIQETNDNKDEIDNYDFQNNKIKGGINIFFSHFKALVIKRIQYLSEDKRGFLCEILLPIIVVILGCAVGNVQFIINQPNIPLNLSYYPTQKIIYSSDTTLASKIDTQQIFNKIGFQSEPYYDQNNGYTIEQWDNFQYTKKNIDNLATFYFRKADLSNYQFQYINLYNTIAPEAAIIFNNQINQEIIRLANNDQNFQLKATLQPFPFTKKQQSAGATVQAFLSSAVFSIGLGFIPASIIVLIVKEKQLKIKHQQMVQGVGIVTYWFSNFFVDMIKYQIFALAGIGTIKFFELDQMSNDPYFEQIIILFIIYGFSMISFTYFFNFLFTDFGSAQTWIFLCYILSGTVLTTLTYIMRLFDTTRSYAIIISYSLKIFPPYLFGCTILDVANYEAYAQFENKLLQDISLYDWDQNGQNIFFLIFDFIFYISLVYIIEKVSRTQNIIQQKFQKQVDYIPHQYDDDVENEFTEVGNSDPKNYTILVDKLRKVYNTGKVGVDNISLGIKTGEVFGLLGVNGAGKTTTFKMLTGDEMPSNGRAYINGFNLAKDQLKANDHIGYCPQFDGLLEFLTVREHLELYSGIRCIPYDVRDKVINYKLKELDLERYKNILSMNLSGGNKRKLQVAMAMLGNPKVIFLDEPSTGMDVVARRFMWDVISRVATQKKQSCIILTTHSMEEAEALCTRMGIMVNGELKCLGSVQHLKSKFGQGLEIEIKTQIPKNSDIQTIIDQKYPLNSQINYNECLDILKNYPKVLEQFENGNGQYLKDDSEKNGSILVDQIYHFIYQEHMGEKINQLLINKFKKVELIEHFLSFYRYKIINNISIGQIFGFFQQNKISLKINQYSIRQASIEQIFNNFARFQINEEEDKK